MLTLCFFTFRNSKIAVLITFTKKLGENQKNSLLRKEQWPAFGHALAVQRDLFVCSTPTLTRLRCFMWLAVMLELVPAVENFPASMWSLGLVLALSTISLFTESVLFQPITIASTIPRPDH